MLMLSGSRWLGWPHTSVKRSENEKLVPCNTSDCISLQVFIKIKTSHFSSYLWQSLFFAPGSDSLCVIYRKMHVIHCNFISVLTVRLVCLYQRSIKLMLTSCCYCFTLNTEWDLLFSSLRMHDVFITAAETNWVLIKNVLKNKNNSLLSLVMHIYCMCVCVRDEMLPKGLVEVTNLAGMLCAASEDCTTKQDLRLEGCN